jgi:hypothetical protein
LAGFSNKYEYHAVEFGQQLPSARNSKIAGKIATAHTIQQQKTGKLNTCRLLTGTATFMYYMLLPLQVW